MSREGHERLWGWFGLSYAVWLTLPRVLMHAMPDDWQNRMSALLEEFDEEFPAWADRQYYVTARKNGKMTKLPEWSSRHMYRHPDESVINELRRKDMR